MLCTTSAQRTDWGVLCEVQPFAQNVKGSFALERRKSNELCGVFWWNSDVEHAFSRVGPCRRCTSLRSKTCPQLVTVLAALGSVVWHCTWVSEGAPFETKHVGANSLDLVGLDLV